MSLNCQHCGLTSPQAAYKCLISHHRSIASSCVIRTLGIDALRVPVAMPPAGCAWPRHHVRQQRHTLTGPWKASQDGGAGRGCSTLRGDVRARRVGACGHLDGVSCPQCAVCRCICGVFLVRAATCSTARPSCHESTFELLQGVSALTTLLSLASLRPSG